MMFFQFQLFWLAEFSSLISQTGITFPRRVSFAVIASLGRIFSVGIYTEAMAVSMVILLKAHPWEQAPAGNVNVQVIVGRRPCDRYSGFLPET